MWVWTLNWGEIRHDLVIGSCPLRPGDVDQIHGGTGASALLSLQTDDCRAALGIDGDLLEERAARLGLVLVNAPIRDFDAEDQRRRLPSAVTSLCQLLASGHRTYLHCTAGINRAPLVALAYLTFVEGLAVGEAMALIERGRPEARPYWEAYHGCRDDALAAHHASVDRRARSAPRSDAEQEILGEVFRA